MKVLDSKTNILTAAVYTPASLVKYDPHHYWNATTHQWETAPPTNISVGSRVGFSTRTEIISKSSHYITQTLRIYHPDGTLADEHTYDTGIRNPGNVTISSFLVTSTQAGVYKGTGHLYADGNLAGSITNLTIATTVGALSASIRYWYLWHPNTGTWESGTNVPNVPIGSSIGIQPNAKNQSSVPLRVRLDTIVIDPGKTRTTLTGGNIILQPNDSATWDFIWTATKEGGYNADLILYGEAA